MFGTKEAAEAAAKFLEGRKIDGKNAISTSYETFKDQKRPRIIVRNLSFHCSEEKLREVFAKYGKLVEVQRPKKEDGQLAAFAFVQYEKMSEAEKAMKEMNLKPLAGRPVAIDWSLPKDKYLKHMAKFSIAQSASASSNRSSDQKTDEDSEMKDEEEEGDEDDDEDDDDESEEGDDDEDDEEEEEEEDDDLELEDEKEEEEEEEEDDDYEEDEDGEEEDEEENEEDEEEEEEEERSDVDAKMTIFIRNLSFETNEEALEERFRAFGDLKYAVIVRDQETQRSRGTAFVKFESTDSAIACLKEAYPAIDIEDLLDPSKPRELVESNVALDGRKLIISIAVDRKKATDFSTQNKAKPKKTDKRNLYLAYEGGFFF